MVDKSLKEWMYQVTSSGGGGNHKELAQAEYDALTEEEKTNGTVYFITDGSPAQQKLMGKIMYMNEEYAGNGADYIVEQGTSGIWTYRKWASGIAECWGYTTAMTTNCNTAYGYQYYGALATQAFPAGLFVQRPTLSVSCDGGDGLWVGTSAIQSNQFTYYPYCGKNGSHAYALSMHAVGRWK